jgi:hypothetical protein
VGTFENLDEKFGVVETPSTALVPVKKEQAEVEDDAELARRTLRDLIDKGNGALDGIIRVAENSEHPRAYEVASQLIKSVSELAKDLLEVQKQKKELQKDDVPEQTPQQIGTQNNLIFAGSTHDLLKVLRQQALEAVKPPPALEGEVVDATDVEIIEE